MAFYRCGSSGGTGGAFAAHSLPSRFLRAEQEAGRLQRAFYAQILQR